jgi:hypothetical protein
LSDQTFGQTRIPKRMLNAPTWIVAVAAVVVVILVVSLATGGTKKHNTVASGASKATTAPKLGNGPWDNAARQLGDIAVQIRVAQDGGDGVKAQQQGAKAIQTCQADAASLVPDSSVGHADVQQLCATLGVAVP